MKRLNQEEKDFQARQSQSRSGREDGEDLEDEYNSGSEEELDKIFEPNNPTSEDFQCILS